MFGSLCIRIHRWLLSAAAVMWTYENTHRSRVYLCLRTHGGASSSVCSIARSGRSTVGCWLAWSPAQRGSVWARSKDPREEASLPLQYDPHSAPRRQRGHFYRGGALPQPFLFFFEIFADSISAALQGERSRVM